MLRWSTASKMAPSSKTPVRNHQRPPSMTSRTRGILIYLNHARELKFGTQVKYHTLWSSWYPRLQSGTFHVFHVWLQYKFIMVCQDDLGHQRWPHLPRLQSGTVNVLQVWLQVRGDSWHTSDNARELKFGTQVKTPSSKTLVRNLQHPPSINLETDGSWLPSYHHRELQFGEAIESHIHIKNPYILAKWSNIFPKFSGLVPEGPPNGR